MLLRCTGWRESCVSKFLLIPGQTTRRVWLTTIVHGLWRWAYKQTDNQNVLTLHNPDLKESKIVYNPKHYYEIWKSEITKILILSYTNHAVSQNMNQKRGLSTPWLLDNGVNNIHTRKAKSRTKLKFTAGVWAWAFPLCQWSYSERARHKQSPTS